MIDQKEQNKVRVITSVGLDYDIDLIPHFIDHYINLGIKVGDMYFLFHSLKEEDSMKKSAFVANKYGIRNYKLWTGNYTSKAMWGRRAIYQREISEPGDWIISADLDEMHEYGMSLNKLISRCDRNNIDCIQGVFVDRLSSDKKLSEIEDSTPISKQYPLKFDLINVLRKGWGRGGIYKVMLFRSHLYPTIGGHMIQISHRQCNFYYKQELNMFTASRLHLFRNLIPFRVHHYKWTSSLGDKSKYRVKETDTSVESRRYSELILDSVCANFESLRIKSYTDFTYSHVFLRNVILQILFSASFVYAKIKGILLRLKLPFINRICGKFKK